MLDLMELEQLIAFAECGTLSKAADFLNISQPTITRTMQHVEASFGVPLFSRGKNKIELNDTGKQAVAYARLLLDSAENAVRQVRAYDKSLHTIVVESCAPAPLWTLLPLLSASFSGMTISSSLKEEDEILSDVRSGACQIGILPDAVEADEIDCAPFLQESLSLCILPEHALAGKKALTFHEINGFNCLLRSEIGFWDELCRTKMPSSKFLVQDDEFSFSELIRESSLPCFTTNLAQLNDLTKNRIKIPITDPEANVTYHLAYRSDGAAWPAFAAKIKLPIE